MRSAINSIIDSVQRIHRAALAACVIASILGGAPPLLAADLQPQAVQAYEKYAQESTRTFLARGQKIANTSRCNGVKAAIAGSGDGIADVPEGLVHNWIASAFIPGATLRQALEVSRAYATYPKIYKEVLSARVLSQQGDTYHVLIRLKEGEKGVAAVLDIRSTVTYQTSGASSASAVSKSDEIREVENAGRPNESLLPAGRDSGYLWRAHTLTYFAADRGGVAVVMETIGLSRRFPPMLGWIIEPIARRLGRKSVETSLAAFATAVLRLGGISTPAEMCA